MKDFYKCFWYIYLLYRYDRKWLTNKEETYQKFPFKWLIKNENFARLPFERVSFAFDSIWG